MGYTTEFDGSIELAPPLSLTQFKQLESFAAAQHEGGFPGYYCQWVPNSDGTALVWDGGEKFYNASEWMQYLIDHFIEPWGIKADGVINAEGEDHGDTWRLHVDDNEVSVTRAKITWDSVR